MSLIRNTRASLRNGGVRILHRDGTSGHKRILSVVGGVSECVSQPEVKAVGHATTNGKRRAVVHAGGSALKLVDGVKCGIRASERIDTGSEGARHRASHLPSRK